jgi:rod shape-determining protein MreC
MTSVPLKRVLTTLGMFALLCIVILIMDRRALLDPLREGMGEVFNPVVTRFEEIGRPAPSDSELAVQLATAQAEVDSLRSENARLTGELESLETLREQVRIEGERPDLSYLDSRVVGRDPNGVQQILILDRGSADGLRVGMAVVDPDYYVGQIVEVEENRSKVLLITDPNASVGAVLLQTRGDGVVYGTRSSNSVLSMQHVAKDVVPKEQEWIVTSDLSESATAQIPSHIPIGFVIGEPQLNAQNDQLEITVQPAADFQNLETVWIVVPND